MLKLLKSKSGEGYIEVPIIILAVMLVIALAFATLPVFMVKSQLNSFADELCRTAEIYGEIGVETTSYAEELKTRLNISPTISWSKSGNIQLGDEFTVTVTITKDIGFSTFASFPVTLTAKATGRSEVYQK